MRRTTKPKVAANRIPLRKSVTSGTAVRRGFPAWIDSSETTAVFVATRSATPRVRAGLVLRSVSTRKNIERRVAHADSQ